ncbi:hypothetical protein K2Q16_02235 [Patescibacteria group bacterium]|nr:hypothetical protein [Patescibacteria group bacterium]
MADLSSPSFIPKQNPVKNTRRAASRQVYILTLVSYLMIITTLIAVVGLFIYDRYTQTALANEIEALNKEISDFNAEDMEALVDLNEQLEAAESLLDQNVSLRAVLAIVERATIDTVQFKSVEFTRVGGNNIQLDATIITDSFDSVLFQREMFEQVEKIEAIELQDVSITLAGSEPDDEVTKNTVSFTALFSVNSDEVPYVPVAGISPASSTVPAVVPPPVMISTTTATVTSPDTP